MSDEITYTDYISVSKGSLFAEEGRIGASKADMTGNKTMAGVLDLTTDYEAIPKGDIGTIGMVRLENLGTVDIYVRESLTGDPRIVVKPGESCRVRLASGMQDPAACTASSTAQLKFLLVED